MWYKNNLINKSELARQIGIAPDLFRKKMINFNYNKFNKLELEKLEEIRQKTIKMLELIET